MIQFWVLIYTYTHISWGRDLMWSSWEIPLICSYKTGGTFLVCIEHGHGLNLAGPIIFMDFYHQLLRMIIVCQARVHVCLMAMDLYICLGWLLMKIHDGFMIIPFKLLSSWWHCNPLELFVKYIIWAMRMCLEEMWFSD